MIDQENEKIPKSSDSFYDDTTSSSISEIRIVPSKPPVYHQQSQNSNSLSHLSDSSEYDITNVSSISKKHQHPFHLESMRHVLFGLSTPTSRSSSPVYSYPQQLTQKHSHHHYRIRLTSSAINRQKQQQRIERENLKILERLQHIRPNRSLKREELLSNYDRQMGVIAYTTEPRFRPPSRSSSATPVLEKNHRTQNRPTSVSNNSMIRSRPVSTNNRSSSIRKPIWNDRWQQQE